MKVTFISREKNDVKFEMAFTSEEFENAQIKAYQNNKDKFQIDGFRKGKAPRKMIENMYGEGVFFEDAIDNLFNENYVKALDELNANVIASPRAEFGKIEKNQPLTITITVEVEPEVEAKDYKGVSVEKVENKVKAADVNKQLEAMQKKQARSVSVDRPAKLGDTLLLNYSGFVDDKQFDGGTAENQNLKLGSGMFIPGFEDQLVGVTPGEKRDVNVKFPEEYGVEELNGKDAVFHCLVHEINEEQLPELDDEFAKDVSEFDTLDELKKDLKKNLEKSAKEAAINQMKDNALLKVVDNNKVDCPESMVNDEIDRTLQQIQQNMQYQGLTIDQYLEFTKKTMEDLRAEIKPDAERQVKTRLILQGIVRQEKITVTDSEVETELKDMAKMYQMDLDKIKEALGEDNIKYLRKDLEVKKAIDFIFDNAKVIEPKKEEKEEK